MAIGWVRSHIGITGNEKADKKAAYESALEHISGSPQEQDSKRPARPGGDQRSEPGWHRHTLSAYTWLCTNRGPFNSWLYTIAKVNSPTCPHCNHSLPPFTCLYHRQQRLELIGDATTWEDLYAPIWKKEEGDGPKAWREAKARAKGKAKGKGKGVVGKVLPPVGPRSEAKAVAQRNGREVGAAIQGKGKAVGGKVMAREEEGKGEVVYGQKLCGEFGAEAKRFELKGNGRKRIPKAGEKQQLVCNFNAFAEQKRISVRAIKVEYDGRYPQERRIQLEPQEGLTFASVVEKARVVLGRAFGYTSTLALDTQEIVVSSLLGVQGEKAVDRARAICQDLGHNLTLRFTVYNGEYDIELDPLPEIVKNGGIVRQYYLYCRKGDMAWYQDVLGETINKGRLSQWRPQQWAPHKPDNRDAKGCWNCGVFGHWSTKCKRDSGCPSCDRYFQLGHWWEHCWMTRREKEDKNRRMPDDTPPPRVTREDPDWELYA
ncbi:hypothetical protein EV426DRAFT_706623 [Tirmania nivea]|nr:hypothetical protein EV426DRAFT_706623 [Tirmania nivea]